MTYKPTNTRFGRKFKILVLKPSGSEAWNVSDSDWSNSALRCTFRAEKAFGVSPWYTDLTIYNLAGDTEAEIVSNSVQGYDVIIEAGYQSGNYGVVSQSSIFQPLFTREGVTDFILTLHCWNAFGLITSNFCSFAIDAGYDYAGIIRKMAASARNTIPVGTVTDGLSSKKLARGKTFFGEPQKYLRQMTRDNNGQWWIDDDGKLQVAQITDIHEKVATVVSPETGLIGTPQQVENGVFFRTLLNPRLSVKNPPMVVKIDNAAVRQLKAQFGYQPPTPLDEDGYYKIIRVVHTGDTRGDEWYTEVTAVNLKWPIILGMGTN